MSKKPYFRTLPPENVPSLLLLPGRTFSWSIKMQVPNLSTIEAHLTGALRRWKMKISSACVLTHGLLWHFNYISQAHAVLRQILVGLNRRNKRKTTTKILAQPLSRGLRAGSFFVFGNLRLKKWWKNELGTSQSNPIRLILRDFCRGKHWSRTERAPTSLG